ncbi:MAG: DUF92 domain-containing protein [Anaerolineales bacterium]|nr:DUF92 domain-containing protein [Anaerolineales bacterium]MCX7607645.1 DUF92 domain-containing protein [Anaerolineales bacterium]
MKLLIGFLFAAGIALIAYRARSLSTSGVWGALLVGTLIFGVGGWEWAILLLAFFISSSLLTRLFGRRKTALNEKFEKGGQRDLGQVLANGGIAALLAALSPLFPASPWTWVGFAASLAAVNADTWATELGVLNPYPPRLITNGKAVERGTSGAISFYGTLAATAGAAFIAGLTVLLTPFLSLPLSPVWLFVLLTLAGLFGALFDSLLGATVQAIYRCPQCEKETEKHPVHTCGARTAQVRGWKWFNNDLVNLSCALAGAMVGMLLV